MRTLPSLSRRNHNDHRSDGRGHLAPHPKVGPRASPHRSSTGVLPVRGGSAVFHVRSYVIGWLFILGGDQPHIWALASLEAECTVALPPIILAGGVVEHTVQHFWRRAEMVQIGTPGADPWQFRRVLRAYYLDQLVRYLLLLGA